jgi:hypothetical protein
LQEGLTIDFGGFYENGKGCGMGKTPERQFCRNIYRGSGAG